MTLDEYDIKLTYAYLKGDQAALDDLKLRAMVKLHTVGDRALWERWEQHRMLESLIQDWPEPLLRKDLTQHVMLSLEGANFFPTSLPDSPSDPELISFNSSSNSSINSLSGTSIKSPSGSNRVNRSKSAAPSASPKKAKVTKLDSFTITPPDQQHQIRRHTSRIGFTLAVFMVGVSLGLAIHQTVNSFFYGTPIVAEQPLLTPTFDANINQNNVDLTKALNDATNASHNILGQTLNDRPSAEQPAPKPQRK